VGDSRWVDVAEMVIFLAYKFLRLHDAVAIVSEQHAL